MIDEKTKNTFSCSEDFLNVNIEDYHDFNMEAKLIQSDNTKESDRELFFDMKVYDNQIMGEIIEKIYNFCLKGKWDICHFSNAESDNCFVTSFFKLDVYYNDYFKHFLTKIILPIIDLPNKENIIIDRAYINGHQYGSPGDFHVDGRSSPKNSGPTIMVYLNPFWDPRWNGGTLFLKESKTENGENIQHVQVVDFVPGRIVVFEPSIKHCSSDISIFSKVENITRFSLAYHTIYKNNC